MKSIDEIKNELNQIKKVVKNKYRANIIGLFGSYVRGEAKSSSDIDILVEFDKDADLFDLVGLSLFLEEKFSIKVDVVPRDALKPELKKIILNEVVPV